VTVKRSERARTNTNLLIERFSDCLRAFEAEGDGEAGFSGASVYFHEQALRRRDEHTSPESLVNDVCFMEYVYATLCAWGMHHTGDHKTKLVGFNDFCRSFQSDLVLESLSQLWNHSITSLATSDESQIAAEVWSVIKRTRVSASETRIVAGSKALHHVLPNLIPPIDRRYTMGFFVGHTNIDQIGGGERIFEEIFPLLSEIGRARAEEIHATVAGGGFMETGPAKVIDNAIVGFMYMRIGV